MNEEKLAELANKVSFSKEFNQSESLYYSICLDQGWVTCMVNKPDLQT